MHKCTPQQAVTLHTSQRTEDLLANPTLMLANPQRLPNYARRGHEANTFLAAKI